MVCPSIAGSFLGNERQHLTEVTCASQRKGGGEESVEKISRKCNPRFGMLECAVCRLGVWASCKWRVRGLSGFAGIYCAAGEGWGAAADYGGRRSSSRDYRDYRSRVEGR